MIIRCIIMGGFTLYLIGWRAVGKHALHSIYSSIYILLVKLFKNSIKSSFSCHVILPSWIIQRVNFPNTCPCNFSLIRKLYYDFTE